MIINDVLHTCKTDKTDSVAISQNGDIANDKNMLYLRLNGMKPSSSAGSQSSFIRALVSSLVNFSPAHCIKVNLMT